MRLCSKVAAYFFIPVQILTDDSKDLPATESLQVDADLLSIQRNDLENEIERQKQKHFFSRNWRMIPVFNLSKKESCVKREKTGSENQSSLSKEIVLLSKKRLFKGTENLLQTLSRRSLDLARLR